MRMARLQAWIHRLASSARTPKMHSCNAPQRLLADKSAPKASMPSANRAKRERSFAADTALAEAR